MKKYKLQTKERKESNEPKQEIKIKNKKCNICAFISSRIQTGSKRK